MSQTSDTKPLAEPKEALPVTDPGASAGQPFEIAILALQNLTLFPETVIPLAVGRPRSMSAVEAALSTQEKLLGCVTVRPDRADDTDAKSDDLYGVGTLVMIKRMERVGDAMRIVVQGTERIKIVEWKQQDPYMRAVVQILPEPRTVDPEEVEAAKRNLQQMIQEALSLLPSVPPEVRVAVLGSVEAVRLAYFLGSILTLGVEEEQKMLEAETADELLRLAHANVARELEILQLLDQFFDRAMYYAAYGYEHASEAQPISTELNSSSS